MFIENDIYSLLYNRKHKKVKFVFINKKNNIINYAASVVSSKPYFLLNLSTFPFLGYVTKIDLSKISTMLFMGLIGIILLSILNIFMGNSTLDIILGCIGLILFIGYTAYDMQKIKYLQNTIDENKLPIYGALQLYLDFINIFMYLLRLFGRGSDS